MRWGRGVDHGKPMEVGQKPDEVLGDGKTNDPGREAGSAVAVNDPQPAVEQDPQFPRPGHTLTCKTQLL